MATYDCEVFSIHDAYVKGAYKGDVDDIAAIFYLARKFASKRIIIYIVNDIELERVTNKSKLDKFNEEYGNTLREICKDIIFFGISGKNNNNLIGITKVNNELFTNLDKTFTPVSKKSAILSIYQKSICNFPDELRKYFSNSKKIIICAPINYTDVFLLNKLNNIEKNSNQTLYCQGRPAAGSYNFKDENSYLIITSPDNKSYFINGKLINWYDTPYTNRRFNIEKLIKIVGDNPTIIKTMMKYAIMKSIFLPNMAFILGVFVSKKELKDEPSDGAGTGNNAVSLLIYNPPDAPVNAVNAPNAAVNAAVNAVAAPNAAPNAVAPSNKIFTTTTPHTEIETYFKKKYNQPNIEQLNNLVEDQINGTFIKNYTENIISMNGPKTSEEVKRRFKYAMAYLLESIPKLLDTELDKMLDLGESIKQGLYDQVKEPSVDCSSPMFDLLTVYYITNNITRENIERNLDINDPNLVNTLITDQVFNEIEQSIPLVVSPRSGLPVRSLVPAGKVLSSRVGIGIGTRSVRDRLYDRPGRGGFIRKKSKKIYKNKH